MTRGGSDRTVSVVLPTPEWTTACDELARQVGPDDEFLVACDRPDDPVVTAATDTPAEVVVAGEPEGCSAKCNALAAGLERASGEYLVCTDADFEHGEGWLSTVLAHLDAAPNDHVVSTAPVVVSESPLARALEGPGAVGAALTVLLETTAWGGTMAFHRDAVDLDAYVRDLRRTVSDDALLTQRVAGVRSVRSLVREMPVAGTLSDTLDRQVRWTRTALYNDPGGLAFGVGIQLAIVVGTLLAPLVTVPLVTALAALAYAYCGRRRWTFLLTVPAYVATLPLLLYGLAAAEFDWHGRRYRWTGLYDVEVVDRDIEATDREVAVSDGGSPGAVRDPRTDRDDGYKTPPFDSVGMDHTEFVETVLEENRTPLSRLGSSKAMYADTEGEMDDDAVLAAAGARAHHAAETFADWADDEGDDVVADLFASAAETERDHVETIADERGEDEVGEAPAIQEHLRTVEGTVERLGAFVGWALAAGNNADQVVGYFVGQASPMTASTFREVSSDYDDHVDATADALTAVCEDEDDWDRALAAAGDAIEADYDDYFETLESLGVNPKPVC